LRVPRTRSPSRRSRRGWRSSSGPPQGRSTGARRSSPRPPASRTGMPGGRNAGQRWSA